jgi:hypothetical protein
MITIIMPFYQNQAMLARHYLEWSSWPPELRARFRFIIVDDGSPTEPAAAIVRPVDVAIYRVLEDRPWHQHGARNLGAHVAEEGWLLLTDIDHMIERATAERLVELEPVLHPASAYMFVRLEADTRLPNAKRHPNSFLLTRRRFWEIGGYDEDYCGVYGTDSLFRKRIPDIQYLDDSCPLVRYWRDIVPDASTRTLARKEGRDPGAKAAVRAMKRRQGRLHKITTLAFEWERVC